VTTKKRQKVDDNNVANATLLRPPERPDVPLALTVTFKDSATVAEIMKTVASKGKIGRLTLEFMKNVAADNKEALEITALMPSNVGMAVMRLEHDHFSHVHVSVAVNTQRVFSVSSVAASSVKFDDGDMITIEHAETSPDELYVRVCDRAGRANAPEFALPLAIYDVDADAIEPDNSIYDDDDATAVTHVWMETSFLNKLLKALKLENLFTCLTVNENGSIVITTTSPHTKRDAPVWTCMSVARPNDDTMPSNDQCFVKRGKSPTLRVCSALVQGLWTLAPSSTHVQLSFGEGLTVRARFYYRSGIVLDTYAAAARNDDEDM